ncbi:endodeoxyribonuclease [Coemansia sp. RSA 2050]|nr:endodeoxyribonuclease [Coemansia sp. RSA 2050]
MVIIRDFALGCTTAASLAKRVLGYISCPKGLMHGSISLELHNGDVLDFSQQSGHLVPHVRFVERVVFHSKVTAVLIVEKETVFFALVQSGFQERFPQVILATGKGYPDINTRELLAMFSSNLRVAVLVDCDPDGAHIYQVYAEGGWNNCQFYFPHARWAGLHCSMARVGKWGLNVDQMIEYTRHDRGLALRLLKRWISSVVLRRRMAKMLYRGKKAELEAITQYRGMLLEYVGDILADQE